MPSPYAALSQAAIAAKAGLTPKAVSYKVRKGMSHEAILAQAEARKASGKSKHRGRPKGTTLGAGAKAPVKKVWPRGGKKNENFDEAQCRKEIALANLKELEEAQKRGELLPAKLVLDWMDTSVVRAREIFTGIVGLVERIRQEADTITAQQMVEAELERGFEEMEGFCKKVTKMMFKKQEKAEAA